MAEKIPVVPTPDVKAVDPKTIDYKGIGFKYTQTRSFIMYKWFDGKWDDGKLVENPFIPVHIAASALHYGEAVFEGLKAFKTQDGQIKVFRPLENARRMIDSCKRLVMQYPSEELFMEAIEKVLKDNIDYVPPFESNGSMYIRPICFGSGAEIGVAPANEYTFIVLVSPVGAYYKGGLKGVKSEVITEYDRAAPKGTGAIKCAGNYAASLLPHVLGLKAGYPVELYLDAKTNSMIEEFSTSNFAGITVENGKVVYHTPGSHSVLPSITNKTLREICQHYLNWEVRIEDIYIKDVQKFTEVFATGTAVVVTPVNEIDYMDHKYMFKQEVGEYTQKLYDTVQGIQYGKIEDKLNWNWTLPQ